MSDIASVLKAEITRLARKELRAQLGSVRDSAAKSKTQIAALREEVNTLKAQIRALTKQTRQVAGSIPVPEKKPSRQRFTPNGFATLRKKLGLNYSELSLLIEAVDPTVKAGPQSVKNWEDGAATPREKAQQAIFALRGIGKREAAERLAAARAPKA